MPDLMLMGVSEEKFWNSTVRQLRPYGLVYERKQFEIDRISHQMGAYVYEAVATALANAFSKYSNHTYRDKPYLSAEQERKQVEHMTEEERMDRVEEIFSMLSSGNK